jgi:hypothetical protein
MSALPPKQIGKCQCLICRFAGRCLQTHRKCAWIDCSEGVRIDVADKSGLKVCRHLCVGLRRQCWVTLLSGLRVESTHKSPVPRHVHVSHVQPIVVRHAPALLAPMTGTRRVRPCLKLLRVSSCASTKSAACGPLEGLGWIMKYAL